jgi:hypothetical protein
MAILNITECHGLTTAQGQVPYFVPVAYQGVVTLQEITSITATPQQSSAFQTKTTLIRLCADIDIRYAVGTNPTAGATGTRLAADVLEYVGVPRGQSFKISVRTA